MTKERYDKIRSWFLRRPAALAALKALNAWLPRLVYCGYPLLLACLALRGDGRFFRVLLVPAAAFGSVTVLRKLWDRPRPYEALDIEPLIPRNKKGHSFPSRHVASVTVIALAFFYVSPPLGLAMTGIALLIALIRPLAGIHFPRDVAAGAAFSLLLGLLGFWVI